MGQMNSATAHTQYLQSVEALEESRSRIKEATDQILRVSSQLHLTWFEFEEAVERVKKFGRIS